MYLQKIKEHAADLFHDYYLLQQLKDKGTPQRRAAIDQLDPLLREMAIALKDTVQAFNAHQTSVNMPSFRNRVRSDWVAINAVYEHLCKCTNKNSKNLIEPFIHAHSPNDLRED